MNGKLDNTRLWNEAAKAGLLFGLVSVSCLALKELAGMSGSTFLSQAAFIVLWAVEFFGCILLMKKVQLLLYVLRLLVILFLPLFILVALQKLCSD